MDFQGIPAESIVSIRAGNERRQATAKPNHPFKFPSVAKDSNPFKIDVYSPLGSRLVSLDTNQTRHTVDIGGSMSMTLDIKDPEGGEQAQAQGIKIPVPAISGMKAKLGQASEFNTYLERHNMVNFIQDLFLDLLHKRPEQPYDYLSEKLHGAGRKQTAMKAQEEAEMRIDELLDIMQEDKAEIKKQFGRASSCPDMPPYLMEMFASEDFQNLCNDKFDMLDVDRNCMLTAEELFPVIEEISKEQVHSVTFEHCVRFLAIFDEAKTGVLSRHEFFEFVKFLYLMQWLDSQLYDSQEGCQELAVTGSGTSPPHDEVVTMDDLNLEDMQINKMLEVMHQDVLSVKKAFGKLSNSPHIPDWLRETLNDESFVLQCNGQFDDLDVDGSGSLTPDELFPLIVQLASSNPLAVTLEHCERLTAIFDEDKNGVISRVEFVELTRFIFFIMWLENQDQGQEMQEPSLEEYMRIEDMLDMMAAGVSAVKKHMGRITNCPELPPWLHDLLVSESFVLACQSQFDDLDVDANGSLSPDELYPVIISLGEEKPVAVTPEHCMYLTAIFDEDCNGVISRYEFVELVRFIFLVQWLKDQSQLEAVLRLHDVLDMMKQDVRYVKSHMAEILACPDTGAWLRDLFSNEDFALDCGKKYDALDVDGNGTLSKNELVPVLMELTGEHPITITDEHCQQLLEIFDEDSNGVISKTEFVDLAQFVFIMQWLEDQKAAAMAEQAALDFEAEIIESEYRIEQIIAIFQRDKAELKQLLGDICKSPDLPEWFRNQLCSPEFATSSAEQFNSLDADGNGVLSLEELYPVIQMMTGEHPIAITLDHCQQLLEVVDSDKNGSISKDEFTEFVRYISLVKFLEGIAEEQAAQAQISADEVRIDELLDMLEADSKALKKNFSRFSMCPDMPDWMQAQFKQEAFVAECNEKYDFLDADGNGTLSADELYPVIIELSGGHPLSVTIDHCSRLVKIFDQEKKGVLSRTEFVEFVKFVWLHLWLEEQRLKKMMELDSMEAEWRISNLLDMWHHNTLELKNRWGTVCNSPDVPEWLKHTLQDSTMTEACNKQFDELDRDGNGVLTADELVPVIVEMCQEHPLDITMEHCQHLLEIFDEDKSGTIEKNEFLEFVRFIVVVTWLQEQEGNLAPPQTPSMRSMASGSDAFIEDRTLFAPAPPPPGIGQSPEAKVFEGELKATQEALVATQNQLVAVQRRVEEALSGADSFSPLVKDDERSQWQKEKEQLMKELAAAHQLAEMQKKSMAETVGKLMTDKFELESQLMMAKAKN